MRIMVAAAAVLSLFLWSGVSHAFSSKGENCSKCHTLKKDEAALLLKDIAPNIKILDIRQSPVKSAWEVDVDTEGKKGILYLDYSKRYFFSGQLVDIKAREDLTRERMSDFQRVDVSKIPVGDALFMGSIDARHKIIVFTDPDCPFCVRLHEEMKKVIAERRDIAFLIKMFPLPKHKEAYDKAKAIVCEKSLALLDDAFAKKKLPKPSCKAAAVDENIKLAKKLGINGTPALVLPDGRVIPGLKDANAIKDLIDKK